MGTRRQNTTERRLAQVRAIKDRYFADELTLEERIEAKDARIALLEGQVTELERRLERLESAQRKDRQRPRPEQPGNVVANASTSPSADGSEPEQPGFDFYRD